MIPLFRKSEQYATNQFGYDLKEIFRDIQKKQKSSGRKYVQYPSRAAVVTAITTSDE